MCFVAGGGCVIEGACQWVKLRSDEAAEPAGVVRAAEEAVPLRLELSSLPLSGLTGRRYNVEQPPAKGRSALQL